MNNCGLEKCFLMIAQIQEIAEEIWNVEFYNIDSTWSRITNSENFHAAYMTFFQDYTKLQDQYEK